MLPRVLSVGGATWGGHGWRARFGSFGGPRRLRGESGVVAFQAGLIFFVLFVLGTTVRTTEYDVFLTGY